MTVSSITAFWLGCGIILLFIATPVAAFGAGDIVNVANIDGVNYRHGDIENTLLELIIAAGSSHKFEKLDVKRVYFGNWLRDYSQAIDVGGLKQLPADTIRILLWCLSFITFGYATGEFEVTADRLGCYRPEEHIDNPKDYADNNDARQYDQRLRGPVNEGLELKIDPDTGLKTYIASENAGCDTSAGLVRRLLEKSIELGRNYKKENNKNDLYEALRLLGTALHCLEDFSAHSNYTELALRELGVDVFPHVGKNTEIEVRGKKVFPLVTGTFGMTDFLHSVVGELGDKMAQSEVEDMESKLTSAREHDEKNNQTSVLKNILDKVPWDLLQGTDRPNPAKADELKQASAAKAEETKQNPLDSSVTLGGINIEEAKQIAQQTLKDMYPILQFNDQILKAMDQITSKVPGLDELLENISGALQIFVFSLLAPYVKPIIAQARVELKASSEGVLKSSEKGQYEVFENDDFSDPTHSMLSKDHFTNVLNPIAGQIACTTVRFAVPHIVESWSDGSKDVRQVIDDILQVFHHPALRDDNRTGQKAMFETVKSWWEAKDESQKQHLKDILSHDGIKNGNNHEGEGTDEGHGHSHSAPSRKKQDESSIPSAQEGATIISGLVGSLTTMVMKETGLSEKFGKSKSSNSEQRQGHNAAEESSSFGQGGQTGYQSTEGSKGSAGHTSYGQESENGSPRRRNAGPSHTQPIENQSSYGQSSYGRENSNERSSYGRNTTENEPAYSRNTESNTQRSSYKENSHLRGENSNFEPSRDKYFSQNGNEEARDEYRGGYRH